MNSLFYSLVRFVMLPCKSLCSVEWKYSINTTTTTTTSNIYFGFNSQWVYSELTTSPSTRLRTLSPISGEMSLPNCCNVVRKRFNLQSCLAPQAGGSCWLESEAVEDMAGPLLNPLGVDGAPFSDVGEWLLPFSTADKQKVGITN